MLIAKTENKGEQLKKERRHIFESDFAKTLAIFLIALALVGGFWFGLRATLKTDYPLQAVVSGSMIPTLKVGDLVLVQYVNPLNIKAAPLTGDIIIFRSPYNPGEFIVHRAIANITVNNQIYFTTKGDNNFSQDPWSVPAGNIVGKVVLRIPLLGYLKIYLGTPLGMTIVVVLILFLLFVDYIPTTRKKADPEAKPL